jgi:carboxymethylenebutenolidase
MRCKDEGGTSVDQTIINLYDRFTHGSMSRREFLDRLAELAGSTAAAAALLPLLQNNYAQAAIVAADDARLAAERVSYDSPKGKINGYLVRGKALGKRPAVIVIHENRGLNPHIEDVARRLAVEGYLALAPDLLSVNGGTPPEEDKARELHTKRARGHDRRGARGHPVHAQACGIDRQGRRGRLLLRRRRGQPDGGGQP